MSVFAEECAKPSFIEQLSNLSVGGGIALAVIALCLTAAVIVT